MHLRRSDLDIDILSFTWLSTSSGLSHGDIIDLNVSFETLFSNSMILDKEKNERYILTPVPFRPFYTSFVYERTE